MQKPEFHYSLIFWGRVFLQKIALKEWYPSQTTSIPKGCRKKRKLCRQCCYGIKWEMYKANLNLSQIAMVLHHADNVTCQFC